MFYWPMGGDSIETDSESRRWWTKSSHSPMDLESGKNALHIIKKQSVALEPAELIAGNTGFAV